MLKLKFASLLLAVALSINAYAGVNPAKREAAKQLKSVAAGCSPATASRELTINNTRALIHTGGDMWWDLLGEPKYEVPNGSGQTAIFAGSLWLGGQDVSGQLKVAAQRFRSNGNDYWPGPLSTVDAEIDANTCAEYDQFFESYRDDIVQFVAYNQAVQFDSENGTNTAQEQFPNYTRPPIIDEWPAHGRNFEPYNEDYYLAPFTDVDGDGNYNPDAGDYPAYDLQGTQDCNQRIVGVYGDQNLWWVFNDKGNVHTESGAQAIGMEIRAQAFAFATNDEVNNMTFYNYELVNRSTFTLTETYFGVWVDADLGCSQDDFVGCDVTRGLGYCYNGDNDDQDCSGVDGYGPQPPAIGVDFFQGPFQDNDGVDNPLTSDCREAQRLDGIMYKGIGIGYGDGIIDNERFGMRKFLYHDNNNGVRGDPTTGVEYYNYLRAFWRDNTRMLYGGTGHINDASADPNTAADFMFPFGTDTSGFGTNCVPQPEWNEITAGNTPFDRRFMQSAGPFTLAPGAVNNITFGVVWARAASGGNYASVEAVKRADDKTQALFDACFQLLNGPDAPELVIQEKDRELLIYITNRPISNNYNEQYSEVDPFIIPPDTFPAGHPRAGETLTTEDRREWQSYDFQGYIVYQLADESVSAADLNDREKARPVFQCDVNDGVVNIKNWVFDSELQETVPVAAISNAANEGIKTSFRVTEDQFASGDPRLVNHKRYYFMAIAYAHNEFMPYDPSDPEGTQATPFLGSRKSPTGAILSYSAIPYKPDLREGGLQLNSDYGDGVEITRIEGTGNGGNSLSFTIESREEALQAPDFQVKNPTYEPGEGPISVKVVDPFNVVEGNYTVAFRDTTTPGDLSDAFFVFYGENVQASDGNPDTIFSPRTINVESEFLLLDYGISISIGQVIEPGNTNQDPTNGLLGATLEFEDESRPWLTGLTDADANNFRNWILAGTAASPDDATTPEQESDFWDWNYTVTSGGSRQGEALDSLEVYESLLGGIIAPYRLTAFHDNGPMISTPDPRTATFQILPKDGRNQLNYLSSVDIVFTSDKSQWTRVPVVEMHAAPTEALGGALKGRLRASLSIDKNGNPATPGTGGSTNEDAPNFISDSGMSWFPGYAVNVETGERLNMAFGESSYLAKENGRDMIWNPTSTITEGPFEDVRYGGKHYIFVFRNNIIEDEAFQFPLDYNNIDNLMPAYDFGEFAYEKLKANTTASVNHVWRTGMWCMLPLLEENSSFLSMEEGLIPTDATIKLRVKKPYSRYAVGEALDVGDALTVGQTYYVQSGPVRHDTVVYQPGEVFTAWTTSFTEEQNQTNSSNNPTNNLIPVVNDGLPLYNFSTEGLAPIKNNQALAEDALDLISVVPNPYYAYSQYEADKLDNRIRIINLPQTCSIKIYTVNGTLVRQFEKDDPTIASLDWDLKNNANVTIAGGVYYIHIEVPGVGEKVLKWFGVLRPIDLDAF